MKIIYGSSTQKNIDRSQRINRREKKKRRSNLLAPASELPSPKPEATGQPEPRSEPLQTDNPQGIPHEISLILPEIPTDEATAPDGITVTDLCTEKADWKGGEVDENNDQRQSESAAEAELVLSPEPASGLDERSRGIDHSPSLLPDTASAAAPEELPELEQLLQSDAVFLFKMQLPPGCSHKPIVVYLYTEEEEQ